MTNILREIDIFGTEIKWRFMSKNNFKSMFGALITLLLAGLFSVKIFLFIKKTKDYGFAKNKISYQFKGESQFLNMSDMRMIVYSDLEELLELHSYKTNSTINPGSYINLSDFIEVLSFAPDNYQKLILSKANCSKIFKFYLSNDSGTEQEDAIMKCLVLEENNSSLNLQKKRLF